MGGRSCEFYADENDLLSLVREFPTLGKLKFVQMRSALNKSNEVLVGELERLVSMAKVTPEAPIRCHSFLAMETDQEIFHRELTLKDGSGKLWIVDQNQNWNSVVIAFGGDAGDQTLVMSDINTTADTEKAKELHTSFKKLVNSMSKKVGHQKKSYFLMAGAIAKAKEGWRLARDKGWQRSTDPEISAEDLAAL